MKQFILIGSAVALLCVQANAETVWQQVGRGLDNIGQAAMAEEMRKEAQEQALAQEAALKAKKEHEQWLQKMYREQDLRNQARDGAFALDAVANPRVYHTDALPLASECDDVATIKIYLHDCGSLVTDEQAAQVRAYLLAHGLKHVSEIF